MKRLLFIAIAFISFGFVKLADDIVATLGTSQYTARLFILGNLAGDFSNDGATITKTSEGSDDSYSQLDRFKLPYLSNLKTIVTGDKVSAAKELCDYVRMYVNSEEFAKAYQEKREKAKPTEEPWRPDAEQIKAFRDNLKQSEKDLADMKKQKMPANMINQMEDGIAKQKEQIAEYDDPHPNQTKWENAYPEDPAALVKTRLEEYLSLAATVDFGATLTEGGRKKKFTNAAYEKKSLKWKAIYRAGKDVNSVVTAFVRDWLKGEIVAKNKVKMPPETKTTAATPAKKDLVNAAMTGDSKPDEQSASNDESGKAPVKKAKKASMLLKKIKDKVN